MAVDPVRRMRPPSMNATESAMRRASPGSWVTITTVSPDSLLSRDTRSSMVRRNAGPRAAKGSSRSSTGRFITSALARATR